MSMTILHMASAQDSANKPELKFSGAVDVYYKVQLPGLKTNNITSFTNSHQSFELGMATMKFQYSHSKLEAVADLGFGKRAQEFSYNDQGILAAIRQVYISYAVSDWLKLTTGSWATHIGYEVVDAHLNRNYSMSHMFTNGPFFHTGLKAELSFNNSGFMVGIANPADFKYVPDHFINKKSLLAQYSYTMGDQFKAYLNYAGGKNIDTTSSRQIDLVMLSRINKQFSLGFNGTINRTKKYLGNKIYDDSRSWWGSAVYINFDPSEKLGLTLREEYFNDHNRLKVYSLHNHGGSIFSSTFSASIKTDHFIFMPEVRADHASSPIYSGKDGNARKNSFSALFAAIYHF